MKEHGQHLGRQDSHPKELQPRLTDAQKLQFELMKMASFDDFDGERVVADLLANRCLWRGALMTCLDSHELVCLRDMERGSWNVDTLMVLTDDDKAKDLQILAYRWNADEINWLTDEDASEKLGIHPINGHNLKVLKVWWG